jgi:hypothetical protein
VFLSSCESLFVIAPSKVVAKKFLHSTLKKFVSSLFLATTAAPAQVPAQAYAPEQSPPLDPCPCSCPSLFLDRPSPSSPNESPHFVDKTHLELDGAGAVVGDSSGAAPELFRLCPFIRLENEEIIAKAQSHEFLGHLVMIFSSSGSRDVVPATALMLPIMNFLESYRYYSDHAPTPETPSPRTIILSERADELVALTERHGFTQSALLSGVSFYLGSPKNIDHLQLCCVVAAKTVVVLQPPVTYHHWISSSSTPLPSINEDKDSIVVSLSIHHLVHTALYHDKEGAVTPHPSTRPHPQQQEKQPKRLYRGPSQYVDLGASRYDDLVLNGEGHRGYPPQIPFFVAHLNDITNVSYLLPHGQQSFQLPSRSLNHRSRSSVAETPLRNDWNLISSGGVLTQYLFYSLLLHSFLAPDLIALWEDILRIPESLPPSSSLQPLPLPRVHRIPCPLTMVGAPYSSLVEGLITPDGEMVHIPIAVYRQSHVTATGLERSSPLSPLRPAAAAAPILPPECLCRDLPYLFLTPPGDFTLQREDFIFFFSSLDSSLPSATRSQPRNPHDVL